MPGTGSFGAKPGRGAIMAPGPTPGDRHRLLTRPHGVKILSGGLPTSPCYYLSACRTSEWILSSDTRSLDPTLPMMATDEGMVSLGLDRKEVNRSPLPFSPGARAHSIQGDRSWLVG